MLFYGVVSSVTETALELFVDRAPAEAFLDQVRADEPDTARLPTHRRR